MNTINRAGLPADSIDNANLRTVCREGEVKAPQSMTAIPRRKRVFVVSGLLLLAGLGWVLGPFMASPRQIQSFCSSLATGTSVAEIQAQAAQHGYRVSSVIENRAFVHESRSFGRFTCELRFGPDGLVSSVYLFND